MEGGTRFKFAVVGRFRSRVEGNDPQVIVSVLTGRAGHLVFSGSLTMTEAEWAALSNAMKQALGDGVELEDRAVRLDATEVGN